ncbi:hypothetical protein R9X47_01685 [Wukongibacter baidiensis]|uniref:hypothetical protein n=1 Tax=Wukongibacter baidiensis TaxID=1723361 RepID=UPI003D7F58FC
MEEVREIFIPFGLLILAIAVGYTLKLSKSKFIASNKKKLEILFMYTPMALAIIVFIHILSDTMFDFIYVNLIVAIITWINFVVEKRIKGSYKIALIHYTISYIIAFFVIKEINKHLVIPITHIWMINLVMANIIFVIKDGNIDNKRGLLSFSANLIGIAIVAITMNYLSEPLAGTSKQEYLVRSYLLEEGYERNEIIELRRIGSIIKAIEAKEAQVYVRLLTEDKEEKSYKYIYENGNIKDIQDLKH